jgi:hypothetical protein
MSELRSSMTPFSPFTRSLQNSVTKPFLTPKFEDSKVRSSELEQACEVRAESVVATSVSSPNGGHLGRSKTTRRRTDNPASFPRETVVR